MNKDDVKKLYNKYSQRIDFDSAEEYQKVIDQYYTDVKQLIDTADSKSIKEIENRLDVVCDMVNKLWADSPHKK